MHGIQDSVIISVMRVWNIGIPGWRVQMTMNGTTRIYDQVRRVQVTQVRCRHYHRDWFLVQRFVLWKNGIEFLKQHAKLLRNTFIEPTMQSLSIKNGGSCLNSYEDDRLVCNGVGNNPHSIPELTVTACHQVCCMSCTIGAYQSLPWIFNR